MSTDVERQRLQRDSPDLMGLGTFIREQRQALGLTQSALADRLDWSQERVSTLECGHYGLPTLPTLLHLARALRVPLATLITAAGFDLRGEPDGEDAGHVDAEPVAAEELPVEPATRMHAPGTHAGDDE